MVNLLVFRIVSFFRYLTGGGKMITPILISIISPSLIAVLWLFGSKELTSFSEPVVLILSGLLLIKLANFGKNKF